MFGDHGVAGWPLDSEVTVSRDRLVLAADPFGPAAWGAAEHAWARSKNLPPTEQEATQVLHAALRAEADERGWTIDWDHSHTWFHLPEVRGTFPLLWRARGPRGSAD